MTTKTKTKYVAISNTGEIDINAFRLIGASTKREDDTKIGFFGSGLKYAIAVLMREGIDTKIYSGEKEIKLGVSKQQLGGETFEVIKFNNRLTSLTTSMGVDWELWFAIREIYCNALDAGGSSISVTDSPVGEKGKTVFYLDLEKINEIFKNWDDYFCEKRDDIIYTNYSDTFFSSKGRLLVYRKGVRVLERQVENLFDYNLSNIEINEARTVVSEFELEWQVVNKLKDIATEEMVKEIYNNRNSWEATRDWSYGSSFNDNWLKVLEKKIVFLEDTAGNFTEEMDRYSIVLPNRLALALKQTFGAKIKIWGVADTSNHGVILEKTEKQKTIITECLEFLSGVIDINYKIDVCDFDAKSQLGGVDKQNETILLSTRVFDMGRKQVLCTIIEEYAHLYSNADDKTRRFQDFLIQQFIGSIEERKNIYL